jgi:hypothetical protein
MPPSTRPSLALVLPGFSAALRRSHENLPALERLVARSVAEKIEYAPILEPWQCELLHALKLADYARYPSARLTWVGLGGESDDGTWLHADPIRFEMSNEGMKAALARAWSSAERSVVEKLLINHVEDERMSMRIMNSRVFLHSTTRLNIETIAPHEALRRPLQEALPQGADAAQLRRLMTELQMLLHEKISEDAANAIWLWGAASQSGKTPAASPLASNELPLLFTNDPYARGLYFTLGAKARCAAPPESFGQLGCNAKEKNMLVVLSDLSAEGLEEKWFAPALQDLNRGRIENINLCFDGVSLVARHSMWQFLKRSRLSLDTLLEDAAHAS